MSQFILTKCSPTTLCFLQSSRGTQAVEQLNCKLSEYVETTERLVYLLEFVSRIELLVISNISSTAVTTSSYEAAHLHEWSVFQHAHLCVDACDQFLETGADAATPATFVELWKPFSRLFRLTGLVADPKYDVWNHLQLMAIASDVLWHILRGDPVRNCQMHEGLVAFAGSLVPPIDIATGEDRQVVLQVVDHLNQLSSRLN